ncbi:hypothetical protein M3P05_16470 [Sansalvadorimonas sp. 2012CJ34-2]|uniref:Uncharacterized protein n=1 Tax=Parendozoicomonas callyspongiae TaxID=2942213 RepID=A0ABT0PM32_9GAMM|nr:hypothetical protein [Sansalvadorimonas sp. 2012CJ34-2]MCL6271513.1 hypothetical protein [Sansalvadorimonas sp. 2012CJ34-2]
MAYRMTGDYGRQCQTEYHNPDQPQFNPNPTSLKPMPGRNYTPIPVRSRTTEHPPIHTRQISEAPEYFDSSSQQLFDYMNHVAQFPKGAKRNHELKTILYAINHLNKERNPNVRKLTQHMHQTRLIPFSPERLEIFDSNFPGSLEGAVRAKTTERAHFLKSGGRNFSLEEVKAAIEWLSEIHDSDTLFLLQNARELYRFRTELEPNDKTYEARILQNMSHHTASQPPASKPEPVKRDYVTRQLEQHTRRETSSPKTHVSPEASASTESRYSQISFRGCGNPTIRDFDQKAPVATLVTQLIEKGHPLHSHGIMFAGKMISEGDDLLLNMSSGGHNPQSVNGIHLLTNEDLLDPLKIYIECFTWKDSHNQRHSLMDKKYNEPDKIEAALVTLFRQSRGLPVDTPINDAEFLRLRQMLVTVKEHIGESTRLVNHREKAETYFQTLLTCMDLHRYPGKSPIGKDKPSTSVPRSHQPAPRQTTSPENYQPVQRTTYTAPRIEPLFLKISSSQSWPLFKSVQ